jgi:hypothetical protein
MKQSNNKKMEAILSNTVSGILEQVNEKGIQKEDIVQTVPTDNGFILLYYK